MKKVACLLISSTLIAGCANSSKNIATTYVSPLQYKDYTCDQISAEMSRILGRVSETGGRLDQAASNDAVIMGVSAILFWPALFALGGTKQQEAEYGRLKGEYEALGQMAVQKNCTLPTELKSDPTTKTATDGTQPASATQNSSITTSTQSAPSSVTAPISTTSSTETKGGTKLSTDAASKKCLDLGFKADSNELTQCVNKLIE